MKKLKAVSVSVSALKPAEIEAMFTLFVKYYQNVSNSQFLNDLRQKDTVFLLKDTKSLEIKGFSTIVSLRAELEGQPVQAFFSGDTVVERDYWGQGTLGVAFLLFLFRHKLRRPFQPLYWFLISKGYKTYLLMANNFDEHYPRYERATPPEMQKLIDHLSRHLYGNAYEARHGIIRFDQASPRDALRQHITPITPELLENPRIAFFQTRNPGWSQGDELACIAQMTLWLPFSYQLKHLRKRLGSSLSQLMALRPQTRGL